MNNSQISQKQAILMVAIFIIGTSSLTIMALDAKKDMWIANLLGASTCALIMLLYARLINIIPGKDFFETLEYFFGKIGSKIVILIFIWYAIFACSQVFRNFGQFVVTVGLKETPFVVVIFLQMLLCAMAARSGIEVLGRLAEVSIIPVISFMILSAILVSQNMDISNILPVLDEGVTPIAKGALGVLSFPLAETIIFLFLFPAFKKGTSVKKIFLTGLLISFPIIFITSLSGLLVLGVNLAENSYYPIFTAMATINYGNFLQRLEIIAAFFFVLSAFFKISIYLLGISKGTAKLFGFKNYRFIIIPISFLTINVAIYSFDSVIDYHEWTYKVWPYYAMVFQVLLPLILLIIIQIKLYVQKRTN